MFKKFSFLHPTFLLVVLTSLILNTFFLKDFWGYGFGILEDWTWLAYYTALKGDLLSKFLEIWRVKGFYQGTMTIYMGFIDQLFPSNYLVIQFISFIGKVTATIMLYLATLSLTKNKLLSFLSSVFFATSYAANGSFITYTNSMEYWGISFLGLFIIFYKKLIEDTLNKDFLKYFLITNLFLFLALQFTYVRLLGLLFVLILVEIVMALKKITPLKYTLLRTITFIGIFYIFITQGYDGSTASTGTNTIISNLTKYLSEGNWLVFLNPLAGLSLTIIPQNYPFVYFMPFIFLTLMICSFILPVQTFRFLLISIPLNSLLILIIHSLNSSYNPTQGLIPLPQVFSQSIFSSLIITLSLSLGLEWIFDKKKNSLLLISFLSSSISAFFIFITWIVNLGKNSLLTFAALDKYLPISTIATSVFLASLFTLVLTRKYESKFTKIFLKIPGYGLLILVLGLILFVNYKEIQFFKIRKSEGVDLSLQKNVQNTIYNTYIKNKGDRIIYYISSLPLKVSDSELNLLIDQIDSWSYVLKSYGGNQDEVGCIMPLTRPWRPNEALLKTDEGVFFKFSSRCPAQISKKRVNLTYHNQIMTMSIDKISAFTLKDGQIIDMTEEVKRELEGK